MKIKNKRVYSTDIGWLRTLKEEYTQSGFDTSLDGDCLTVYAYKRRKPKKSKKERERERKEKEKVARDKRIEKYA